MKRITVSLLLMMLTFASVISMMMPLAEAQTENLTFHANLLAANEVPPVGVVHPTEVGTVGSAVVTLTVTRTAGTITAASARFDVQLNGTAGNTSIILAHIHEGASGVNGPVRVDSGLTPTTAIPSPFGVSFSRSGLTATPAIAQ